MKRLDEQARQLERNTSGPSFEAFVEHERQRSPISAAARCSVGKRISAASARAD
jgi:hypothetical protein